MYVFFTNEANAPLAGGDHFLYTFLIGNVPEGDPAVSQALPFRYLGDPGDGSAIAQALSEAALLPGAAIFIRKGTYNYDGPTPMGVPKSTIVRGEGEATVIVGTTDDNAIFEFTSTGSELGNMTLRHSGTLAAKGIGIIELDAPSNYLHDLQITIGAGVSGGSLISAIDIAGTGDARATKIERVDISIGSAVAGGASSTWLAGIRGSDTPHVVEISDVLIVGGDAGILNGGLTMNVEAVRISGIARVGLYVEGGGTLNVAGRKSYVERSGAAPLFGAQATGSDSELTLFGTEFTDVSGSASIPAVQISGSVNTPARGRIDGVVIGPNFDPAVRIGSGIELVTSVRMCNCEISSDPGDVPVAIGLGSTNAVITGNTSTGSGDIVPVDSGLRTIFGNNIWDTWVDAGTYVRSPVAAIDADTDANAPEIVGHPIVQFAPTATRDINPRTAKTSMAFTVLKSNTAAFGIRINVGGDATWTTPGGAGVTYTLLNSAAAATGSWLVEIDLPNKIVLVTPT